MSELIMEVRTKQDKAEAILFDGHNAKAIIDTLPVNSWKKVGDVYHIFDDVYDGYQVLSEGQFVVSTVKENETQVQVFDGPVFWELYTPKTRLRAHQGMELREKCAQYTAMALQGSTVLPNAEYMLKIAKALEDYIKGDEYE